MQAAQRALLLLLPARGLSFMPRGADLARLVYIVYELHMKRTRAFLCRACIFLFLLFMRRDCCGEHNQQKHNICFSL